MKIRRKRRTLTRDALIIAVLIISVLLTYVGLRFFLATDSPFLVIASGSMTPALEVGDLVIVQGIQPQEIKINDIIAFDPPKEGIGRTVHRVIEIQPLPNGTLTFQTKGDANDIEDQYTLNAENIHGKAIIKIPYIGHLALNPAIPVIIITIIIIIVIFWPEEKRKLHHKPKTHAPRSNLHE